jgi:hypothetical protein
MDYCKCTIRDSIAGENTMKTKYSIFLIELLILLIGVTIVYGGSESRRGTAGALELLLPVGARSSALAGSLNSSITGIEAVNWNPAGVGRDEITEAMFSTFNYIADIKMNFAGVAVNFGNIGTFGFSLRALDFGDIPITTVDQPEGTGSMFTPSYSVFGFTYSNKFTERISGGVNIKYVSEKIVRTSATGVAFDLGIQYLSSTGISLGIVLKNLGPSMKFDGNDLEYYAPIPTQEPGSVSRPMRLEGNEFELPSTLEIGIGYGVSFLEQHLVGLNFNFQNSNFGSDEYRLGVEYCWNDLIYLRGGFTRVQDQDNFIFGSSYGIGIKIPIGAVSKVVCDYGFRNVTHFDPNRWITIKISI